MSLSRQRNVLQSQNIRVYNIAAKKSFVPVLTPDDCSIFVLTKWFQYWPLAPFLLRVELLQTLLVFSFSQNWRNKNFICSEWTAPLKLTERASLILPHPTLEESVFFTVVFRPDVFVCHIYIQERSTNSFEVQTWNIRKNNQKNCFYSSDTRHYYFSGTSV